jgi:hypothetical protein
MQDESAKILTGLFRVDVILRTARSSASLSLSLAFLRLIHIAPPTLRQHKNVLDKSFPAPLVYTYLPVASSQAANLSCAAGEHTRIHGQQPLPLSLSLAAVARGQLIILALPIPHLQQHTGHCAAAPANDEDEMHDQRLNRASTTRTQLQKTTSRK